MNNYVFQYIKFQNYIVSAFLRFPLFIFSYICCLTGFIVLFSGLMIYMGHTDAWQRGLISEELYIASLQFLSDYLYLLPFIVTTGVVYFLLDYFFDYEPTPGNS